MQNDKNKYFNVKITHVNDVFKRRHVVVDSADFEHHIRIITDARKGVLKETYTEYSNMCLETTPFFNTLSVCLC